MTRRSSATTSLFSLLSWTTSRSCPNHKMPFSCQKAMTPILTMMMTWMTLIFRCTVRWKWLPWGPCYPSWMTFLGWYFWCSVLICSFRSQRFCWICVKCVMHLPAIRMPLQSASECFRYRRLSWSNLLPFQITLHVGIQTEVHPDVVVHSHIRICAERNGKSH